MLILIAALSRNRCIGSNGSIPWHLPEDLKHFKDLTMGHVVVMGRKTWESLPEKFRPLPGRTNVVLTRQTNYPLPADVARFASLADAISAYPQQNLYVIGGAEVYAQALPLAQRLELTHVEQDVDGDAFFPTLSSLEWTEITRLQHKGYAFATYQRKTS